MNKLLKLQQTSAIDNISKNYTLIQIVELLENCGIDPKGNLTNTPKKSILVESLRSVDEKNLRCLLEKARETKAKSTGRDVPNVALHPALAGSKVEKFFKTEDYEESVRVAFLRINNRVKKTTGLNLDGAALMRTAFSKNSPVIKLNELENQEEHDEQEGLMHIFEGSMLAFRNPQSHDDERKMSQKEARSVLELANYLMTLLDNPH